MPHATRAKAKGTHTHTTQPSTGSQQRYAQGKAGYNGRRGRAGQGKAATTTGTKDA